MEGGEWLSVGVSAEVLEGAVVLLLGRALGGVVEWRWEVRWLEVGLQRLVGVHRGRGTVRAAVAARVVPDRTSAPSSGARVPSPTPVTAVRRRVARVAARQADSTVTRQSFLLSIAEQRERDKTRLG